VVPAPAQPARPAQPALLAVARSVLARDVGPVGVHYGPTVAVRGAATTAGCSTAPAVPVRGPAGLPRLWRWLAAVGLLVLRKLGPAVRIRMPDAS